MCAQCAGKDFASVFAWKEGVREWVSVGHVLDYTDEPSCPYCLFFRAYLAVAPQSHSGKFSPYLRIRLAWERFGIPESHPLGRAVVMDVLGRNKALPWGHIILAAEDQTPQAYLADEKKIGGRLVEGVADVELVKTWMGYCVDKHECKNPTRRMTVKLVDVKEKALQEFEGDEIPEYVAVSYVHDEATQATQTLSDDMPRIFEDAMSFTEQLGYRYVYIHPYCRSEGVGGIFSSATLTLIFTTPTSPISTPRTPQLSLQCDARLYLTSLLRPDLEVASSPWCRQGSTFQEGLLSTRKVVFTSSQVYWQCAEMCLCESMCVPLQHTAGLNLGRVFPEGGAHGNAAEYKRTVREYLAKDFAKPEEKVQDFWGVAEHYFKRPSGIDHLVGLPLFARGSLDAGEADARSDRLAFGLSWAPVRSQTGTPAEGYVLDAARQCPSWTWLAWRPTTGGGFTFPSDEDAVVYSASPKMEFSLGLQDGAVVPWDLAAEDTSELKLDFLRLKTYSFGLNVKKEGDTSAITGIHLARTQRDLVKSWVKAEGEWELMGVVLLAKKWREAGDKEAVCLVLGPSDLTDAQDDAVDGGEVPVDREAAAAGKNWTRLGVMLLSFLDFTPLDDETAVLEGMALDGGDRGDVSVSVKEVDVY
ncbi:uncharacterized protein F5Z01DRAFT_635718 [Emericellopsis atlantica]|uniref:Heterokaryon incompatibility domain-containing protein n=1 Tax=Emericellopsis atlantica TaxID=2614577 RepID=A0A9P7ZP04_9HYPO|nr:uncharacterized protein F5Z01DRAFT_635718 [Emericellopsis atlantica]KAG9255446.1 hypothetical protein F5Z01DRAFT_635718 [Emericellopsis atlantica]